MTDEKLKYFFSIYKEMAAQLEIWQKSAGYKGETDMPVELQIMAKRLDIMNICLKTLNKGELFLFTSHVINYNTWDETSKQIEEKWGNWNSRSERTLKRIQRGALLKMVDLINKAGADKIFE